MPRVTIRLDVNQIRILDKCKEVTMDSRSSMIRRAIRNYMCKNIEKIRR